ncbi:MAG: CCA tRNA nucleotidyltransferase [Planctomycetota bacterium]|nr:CCA tRNA nucleotidyltransferase [Planctomycetota bacterium]
MTASDGDSTAESGLREAAVSIASSLIQAGHIAYFAGGCVRDRLLGLEPKDYDIATDARPAQVKAVFPRAQSVGESFGVMLVRRKGHVIEVATFRTDGVYSDRRHPDAVSFTDAEHDARRRDFTINGLFEHPLTGEIIDYVGGREDLEAGVIRAIGDPARRLHEDHLRMLRAIRFAARFRFAIEAETAEAIRAASGELRGISRERIGQEVKWMFAGANRAVAAWEMQYLNVDAAVLNETHMIVAPRRLGRLPEEAAYPTCLAGWLLDRHDGTGTDLRKIARRWGAALMLSNVELRELTGCLQVRQALREQWGGLGVAAQKRLAARPAFRSGLMLLQAEDLQAFVDVQRRVAELAESGLAPDPLLTGDDLVEAGYEPGPVFKKILDGVYDAQLEGAITTRRAALDLARTILAAAEESGGASGTA